MKRPAYLLLGVLCVVLGVIGAFLPLMPTTVFLIIAAWAFARSNPRWEQWLLDHEKVGPSIRLWRERRAIPTHAKRAAGVLMGVSAAGGWLMMPMPWAAVPSVVAVGVMGWMLSRPSQ